MADNNGFDLAGALAALRSESSGAGARPAIVPMWKSRPAKVSTSRIEMDTEGNTTYGKRRVEKIAPDLAPVTADAADASWLDMSAEDRAGFLALARRAGLVGKSPSPTDLASAWSKAVASAEKYNSATPDKSKWVSPWEAVDKLALLDAASQGGVYDQFAPKTTVQRNARVYNSSELANNAEQILRSELGRGPTQAELAAYTIAVNAASAANPQVTTTTTQFDQEGQASFQDSSTAGGIDPNQVMLDRVRNDPERARYQAAAVYLPDVFKALGAVA